MAYNKFTLTELHEKLQVDYQLATVIPALIASISPSPQLLTDLNEAMDIALNSEKAKSEHILVPLLKELRRHNPNRFSYFSGFKFDVDRKKGLNGYCDFILSAHPKKIEIDSPIFCLVEAKKDNIEEGYAQCGAEMIAAQLFNQKHHDPQKTIYGCVTNAFSWCFLKLEENILSIDANYIPLTFSEPHRVLNALQWILDECLDKK